MPEANRPIRVFLCHASQDKPAVRELYQRLKKESWIDPWLDEEKLTLGQHWTSAIEDALDAADVVVIFLSHNSVQKEGFVQRELNYAWEISLEKPRNVIFLIPFRLDNCEVPRYLRSRQWGDYFGEEKEHTYQTLLRSLRERREQKLKLEEELARREKEKQEREAAEKARLEAEEIARKKIAKESAEKEAAEMARLKSEEEARQKAAKEKTDREIAEKAEREKVEKARRDKVEREAAEKTRREKAELEAIKEAEREKAKRDAAEKARHERAERQAAQIATFKETLSKFFTFFQQSLRKAIPFLRIVGIVGIIGGLFWISSWAIPQLSSLFPTASASVTQRPTLAITLTPKPSKSPTVTSTLTEALTQTPSKPFTYVIQEGDTLPIIAEKFNLGNDGILLLLEYNPALLENGGIYFVGQSLTVPPPGTILSTPTPIPSNLPRGTKLEYIVLPGDTLASIAAKFNSKEEDIIIANSIGDSNALSVGQVLQIPVNLVTPTATLPPTSTTLPFSTEITDDKGVQMVLVPAGDFMMGSRSGYDDEKPVHTVYLDTYYIDKYEVTNVRYSACVKAGACSIPVKTSSYGISSYYDNTEYDDYPVVYVDWSGAQAYCEWRNGSLPTEAQWEKAARGADSRTYPWGEGLDCAKTYLYSCRARTDKVGSYMAGKSPYGAFDMAGSVWEWVADWYDSKYYAASPSQNPQGPDHGQYRSIRGGSWVYDGGFTPAGDKGGTWYKYVGELRSADRGKAYPSDVDFSIGFRCAKDANP